MSAIAAMAAPAHAGPQEAPGAPGGGAARVEAARADMIDADVRWLVDVLGTSGALPAVRAGAAERLLTLRDSSDEPRGDAVTALAAGLLGPDPQAAVAILDAMRQVDEVTADLAPALVRFAGTASPESVERVRAAAARLSGDAIPLLAATVLEETAPIESRRSAVLILAAMRRQQSLSALVELLAPDARTRRDLKTLICDVLERSFGQGIGDDPDRWIRWWIDNRFEGQSPAVQSLVQQLRERILALEGQSANSRRELEDVAARLAAAYAEIFVALGPELRMERVAKLMSDPLSTVREQCIGQVERMLANGESLSRSLTQAVAERLGDSVPAHRVRAIKLLEGISRVESAPALAAAFGVETDPEVLAAYLRHFQRLPNPVVADLLVTLLHDPRFSVEAARTLVRLAEDRAIDETLAARAREIARTLSSPVAASGPDGTSAPPDVWFIRLLGVVGDDQDVEEIERLLVSSDPGVRGAAAETMRLRRRLEPLLPLASDPAIYPVLARGLADAPVDLDRLRRLLEIEPPSAAQVADRDAAIGRILAAIDPALLLASDDLLRAGGGALDAVRRDALQRATELPVDALSGDDRDRLVLRLARLLCFSGEAARAATLLEPMVRPDDPELEWLRFASAVLDDRLDVAQQLLGTPGPWLDLLEEVVSNAVLGARVRAAIQSRMVSTMDAEDLARFGSLSARLGGDAESPANASRPPRDGVNSAPPTGSPIGPPTAGAGVDRSG